MLSECLIGTRLMCRQYSITVLFFIAQLLALPCMAATYDIVLNQEANVSSKYSVLASEYREASIHQVFNYPQQVWSQRQHPLNLRNGKNWLAIDITNTGDQDANFYIVVNNTMQLHSVKLYERGYGNTIKITPLTRHYNSLSSAHFRLSAKVTSRVFLTVTADGDATIQLNTLSPNQFVESLSLSQYITGIAIGGMFALALVMLMLFAANGSKSLVILFGYFTIQALSLSVLLGFNLYSVFPETPEFRGFELPLLTSLSAVFLIWFTRELFNLRLLAKRLDKVLKIVGWLLFLYLPLSMVLSLNTNLIICKLIDVVSACVLITVGLQLVRKKQRLALLFTIVILLALIFKLINIVTISWYGFSTDLNTISFWLHGFLITFILSRQYYYQKLDSERAQKESLESAMTTRQAQDELLVLQQETQEQLELRVQERTLELNIALQELEDANRELAEKNTLDDLTGLFNRRHYDQKLLAEFRRSRRNLTPLSIVVIDIDLFKGVNDTYGHVAGDKCLVIIARLIKSVLRRSTDVGCRYGGEEFCLILPETDKDGATAIAEELRLAVKDQAFKLSSTGTTIALSVSCGISTYQQQNEISPEDLFVVADKALYQAKNQGRDQVVFFDLNMLKAEQE